MNSFYIELTSNATYYTNTCANFKNHINLLHKLEGNWEFGIVEISYTKSWYNLIWHCTLGLQKLRHPYIPFIDVSNTLGYVPIEHKRIGTVRRGYYDSVQKLLREIELELPAWTTDKIKIMPKFYYDESVTKLVTIKPGQDKDNNYVVPFLTQELSEILGFNDFNTEKPKFHPFHYMIADRPPDMTNGIRTLYVYCNLGIPQYIGDTRTNLLRTVEIPNSSEFGDQIVIKYDTPHYIPLITNDFEEIEINIKDDMNEPIRFRFGRTRVKLHFRKIND